MAAAKTFTFVTSIFQIVGYTQDGDNGAVGSSITIRTPISDYIPVISRSRPSIPSNARGVVCASAVETPKHAVPHIKGRSMF